MDNRFYFEQMRDIGEANKENNGGAMQIDPQRGQKNAVQDAQVGRPVKQMKAKDDTDSKAKNPVGRPARKG